jgi:hypothetical protein
LISRAISEQRGPFRGTTRSSITTTGMPAIHASMKFKV